MASACNFLFTRQPYRFVFKDEISLQLDWWDILAKRVVNEEIFTCPCVPKNLMYTSLRAFLPSIEAWHAASCINYGWQSPLGGE